MFGLPSPPALDATSSSVLFRSIKSAVSFDPSPRLNMTRVPFLSYIA